MRFKLRGIVVTVALPMLLSACGGGGGVASTPTTPPTPPAPPATYTKLADLTGSNTFNTAGVAWQASSSGISGQTLVPFGNAVTVNYDVNSGTYTINAPGGITGSFSPANADPLGTGGNVQAYVKNTATGQQRLRVTQPSVGGVPLSYMMLGTFLDGSAGVSRSWSVVGGMPTLATDMPKTGSATYTTEGGGVVLSSGVQHNTTTASTASFSANFGTGALSTSVKLVAAPANGGAAVDFGTFNGTGTITSGTSAFTGAFTGTTGPGFAGAFFGPQATEMGYTFNFKTDTIEAFGGVVGKKQ